MKHQVTGLCEQQVSPAKEHVKDSGAPLGRLCSLQSHEIIPDQHRHQDWPKGTLLKLKLKRLTFHYS